MYTNGARLSIALPHQGIWHFQVLYSRMASIKAPLADR